MWLYIAQGIGYGFSAAVLPGPFQTHLITQTLTKGWKRSLVAALAPLVSDSPIITLCLFILSQIPIWFERFLYIAGGLFVLYLAYGAYISWKKFEANIPMEADQVQQSILKAALVNMLSPGPYIFWSLVTGPVLIRGWRETPVNGIGFLAGFYGAMIFSLCAIILIFGLASQIGPKVNRSLLGISAVALLGFGFYQLWLGIAGKV
jgi:threonine/homoserine/homoserine lactone efflux protein